MNAELKVVQGLALATLNMDYKRKQQCFTSEKT